MFNNAELVLVIMGIFILRMWPAGSELWTWGRGLCGARVRRWTGTRIDDGRALVKEGLGVVVRATVKMLCDHEVGSTLSTKI